MGFFLEKEGDQFRVIKTRGTDLEEGVATLSACPNQYCKQTITLDVPVGVEDTAAAGWDDDPLYRTYDLGCYLGTRVTDGDGVYGSVCFASSSARTLEFTDAEYTFLELMGQWLSYELERQQREMELRASKEQLERVFESSHDAIYINDPYADEILDVNQAGCEMLGYSEEDVRSRGPSDFHPDEMDRFREFVDEVYEEGAGWADEFTCLHRDGRRIPVEMSASQIEYDDRQCMLAIVRDISERKEHERSQQRLYEIAADPDQSFEEKLQAVFDLGCDRFDMELGGIAKVDPSTDRFEVEFTNGDRGRFESGERYPLSRMYCSDIVDAEETHAITDPATDGFGDKLCHEEFGIRTYLGSHLDLEGTDDRTFWFVSTESRAEFSEAERTFHHLMGQWVKYEFERQQYERDLEETIDRLQQSNDRLKQFAYAASHDLQEPLRMVSSYLQLLERRYGDDLDGEAREFIDFAVDGADRMRAMVDDLLAFSRVEASDGEFQTVDCDAVLDHVSEDLQVQIEENDAALSVESLPTVTADSEQLEQLFCNLVSNGIKYNDSERPRVDVTVEERTDHWRFAVADNGIGIDPDRTDRIFEVFKRLHHEDEYTGTGIGLSLCQEIVDNHGGDIWVESEPGDGSTFYITLPKRGPN
ncbi:ATP-binding protein [Natrinema amylolyticum]|uniref:ATP-binding protein n=1 Tax=Natrinema amylolyticum TaxID=2878679 RepID=UPI0031BBADA7